VITLTRYRRVRDARANSPKCKEVIRPWSSSDTEQRTKIKVHRMTKYTAHGIAYRFQRRGDTSSVEAVRNRIKAGLGSASLLASVLYMMVLAIP